MDKYEYKVRAEEINSLIEQKKYADAVKIADTIDWRRVKSAKMLCKVSELYKINRRYEDSKEILLLADEHLPNSRNIIYSLCELSIKLEDLIPAIEYYKQFVQIAPRDTGRYILQYRLYEAQDVSLEERIAVLEDYKKRDYREKWGYELAYLYHRIGLATRCVEECDELILWFGEGKYVIKAMELKMLHAPLSSSQQEKYDKRFESESSAYVVKRPDETAEAALEKASAAAQRILEASNTPVMSSVSMETIPSMPIQIKSVEVSNAPTTRIPAKRIDAEAAAPVEEVVPVTQEIKIDLPEIPVAEAPEDIDFQVKTPDMSKFNTINLQKELAKSLAAVMQQEDMEASDATRALPIESINDLADEPEEPVMIEEPAKEMQEVSQYEESVSAESAPAESIPEEAIPMENVSTDSAPLEILSEEVFFEMPEETPVEDVIEENDEVEELEEIEEVTEEPVAPSIDIAATREFKPIADTAITPAVIEEVRKALGDEPRETITEDDLLNAMEEPEETPAPVVEEPAPVVEEEPVPIVEEEPISAVEELPSLVIEPIEEPVVEETPVPEIEEVVPVVEEPAPVVEEITAPVVEEAPASVVEEIPTPVVEEVAAVVEEATPVVEKEPEPVEMPAIQVMPIVEEAPVPVVEEIVAPVVEEALAPIVEEIPTPAVEEVAAVVEEAIPEVEKEPEPVEMPAIQVMPIVEEAPVPVVEEIVAPVVEEAPVPVVEEIVAPVVEEIPTPAIEEVAATPIVEEIVAPVVPEPAPVIMEEPVVMQEVELDIPDDVQPVTMVVPGAVSLDDGEEPVVEKQITGQLSFMDIMTGWEETKKAAEEKRMEEMRQRVMAETGPLLQDLDESAKAGFESNFDMLAPVLDVFDESKIPEVDPDVPTVDPMISADVKAEIPELEIKDLEIHSTSFNTEEINGLEEKLMSSLAKAEKELDTPPEIVPIDISDLDDEPVKEVSAPVEEEKVASQTEEFDADLERQVMEALEETAPVPKVEEPKEAEAKPVAEPAEEEPGKKVSLDTDFVIADLDAPEEEPSEEPAKEESAAEETKEPEKQSDEEEVGYKRSLTKEEKELFGSVTETKKVQEELAFAVDNMDLAIDKNHIILTGEKAAGIMDVAKNLIKLLSVKNDDFSGRVAKVSGEQLNTRNIDDTLKNLNNGALIVEDAGELSDFTLIAISDYMRSAHSDGLLLFFIDVKSEMDKLMQMDNMPKAAFNIRVDVAALDNDGLVNYGKEYALEQEYSIDEMGVLALYTRISERQTREHAVTIEEVKEIVDEAILRSQKSSVSHMMDVIFGKRYDDDDMIILREKDFL